MPASRRGAGKPALQTPKGHVCSGVTSQTPISLPSGGFCCRRLPLHFDFTSRFTCNPFKCSPDTFVNHLKGAQSLSNKGAHIIHLKSALPSIKRGNLKRSVTATPTGKLARLLGFRALPGATFFPRCHALASPRARTPALVSAAPSAAGARASKIYGQVREGAIAADVALAGCVGWRPSLRL